MKKTRVTYTSPTPAFFTILAFLASSKINNLRLISTTEGFDFHTPPPTLCYQADLSEIDSNSGSDSNCAPIWLERRSDAARSSLPTTWA